MDIGKEQRGRSEATAKDTLSEELDTSMDLTLGSKFHP